jgi:hypothetical protein
MISTMSEFVGRLESLGPGAEPDSLHGLVTDWITRVGVNEIRRELLRRLAGGTELSRLRTRARETSTHYVWPVHLTGNGCCVVINEFKDPREMACGYATTIHNHRYSFVSLGLAGRYRQVRSEVEFSDFSKALVRDISEEIVMEGTIMAMHHDEFHRLTDINRHTLTLLVKCPAAKKHSVSVDADTLRVTRHVPVEDRIRHLLSALADPAGPYTPKEGISARSA